MGRKWRSRSNRIEYSKEGSHFDGISFLIFSALPAAVLLLFDYHDEPFVWIEKGPFIYGINE